MILPRSLYFYLHYVFLFSSKTRIYKQNKHTYTQCGAENSLFQFFLTITEPFSPFCLEDMKNYLSLSVSCAVSQLIMRVRKPKVEYKLALQENPREHLDVLLYKQFFNHLTRIN